MTGNSRIMNTPSFLTWSEEYTFADDGCDIIRRPILFDIFIQELRTFLAEYGFVMNANNTVLVSDLAHRIYNATYAMDRKYSRFGTNYGNKTAEEFETYSDSVSYEAWETFTEKWKDVEDFKQGNGFTTILSILPLFAWTYIDTESSMAFLCDEFAEMYCDEDMKPSSKTKAPADPYIQDQQDAVGKYGRKY